MTDAVQNLTPQQLATLLHVREVTVVDVREPMEFGMERIEGALSVPLSTFDPYRLPKTRIVFMCGAGKRSLNAVQLSARAGLPHNAHLEGGLAAWKQAGLPTVRG